MPESKIRERYDRLWGHIVAAIKLTYVIEVFDNSGARTPFRTYATYAYGTVVGVPDWPRWAPASLIG